MQKREATEKYLEKLITFKTSYEISTVPQLTSTSISDAMVDCGLNSSKKTRRRAQCSSSDPPIGTYTNAINIYVACVQKCAEINLFTVRCHAIARAHSILSSSSSRCMVAPFHTKLNYIKNYVWNLAIACWVFLSLSRSLVVLPMQTNAFHRNLEIRCFCTSRARARITKPFSVYTKLNCNTHVWIFMFCTLTEYELSNRRQC